MPETNSARRNVHTQGGYSPKLFFLTSPAGSISSKISPSKTFTVISLSNHASGGSPAFKQQFVRKSVPSHSHSTATCGSNRPEDLIPSTIKPCLPISINSGNAFRFAIVSGCGGVRRSTRLQLNAQILQLILVRIEGLRSRRKLQPSRLLRLTVAQDKETLCSHAMHES